MIALENITARYRPSDPHVVLDHVSLTVEQHQTLVLLGGSGAGKSTVLKAILRLIDLESGRIEIDGTPIEQIDRIALRRAIGMVFQGTALFPHMTIAQNIGLMLHLSGMKARAVKDRVEELLHLVGLDPAIYAKRFPHMLSGGQQQRVGVARALAPRPSYLLMDEPFGALDAITRRKLQEEVRTLRKALDITIVFVTHDVMEAASLADQLAVMQHGRMIQTGSVRELMENPADECVRDLVTQPLAELETFVKRSVD